MSSKNMLKMEALEVTKKRKFKTDQSELSLSKHARFENAACSDNTSGRSELDLEYSLSSMNSSSMECNNEIEMKEESSGSCGEEKMISLENYLDLLDGIQKPEEFSEENIENIIYLDDDEEEAVEYSSNAAKYVMSSGRWNVINQDSTQNGTKKPTIDQEFEHCFSTLMLR